MTKEEIVAKYGHLINNTGGNDPLELVKRLEEPRLMSTNVVVFTLAVAVEGQIALLQRLDKEGLLA